MTALQGSSIFVKEDVPPPFLHAIRLRRPGMKLLLKFMENNFAYLFLLLVLFANRAPAQSNYGAIRGIVTDIQGASLAGAEVSLTDEATKLTRTTTSNGAGEYVFSAVAPGSYKVSVTSSGFSKVEKSGVRVDAGNTIPMDMKLTIGSSAESIEVTAAEPIVNNGTSYNGQLIDSQKLENLPNPGRNPFLFSKLDNNVTPVGDPRFVRFQDQSGSSTISIAGAPLSSNNYAIDGIPITDFSNRAVIIPSIEGVEEVKVQANTYDAEIGRTSGGMFNTTLKSGSSALHGVLQGETRQTNWGANLYFNKHDPNPANWKPRGAAEFYSYVGSLGGPIPLPTWLGGRDKTFFWITEEGYRQRSPLTNNQFTVPTALQLIGNFSDIGTVTNGVCTAGRCIYDPLSNPNARTPFAGNIIPANRINNVGQALLNAYPKANGTAGYSGFNFNGGDTLGDRADEFNGKLTHQFGSRWLADLYYLHYGSKEPGGNALTTFAGSNTSYLLYRKVDAFGVQNTITLNPTTVMTVGFGLQSVSQRYSGYQSGFQSGKPRDFPAITSVLWQRRASHILRAIQVFPEKEHRTPARRCISQGTSLSVSQRALANTASRLATFIAPLVLPTPVSPMLLVRLPSITPLPPAARRRPQPAAPPPRTCCSVIPLPARLSFQRSWPSRRPTRPAICRTTFA